MIDSNQPLSPLDEGDLLAYLDGDAPHEVVRAIEQDAALLAQVEELRQAQMLFGLSLAQRNCPDTDSLVEYQANLLDGKVHDAIAAHLVTCTYCQAEMSELAVGIVWEEAFESDPEPAANWQEVLREAGRQLVELVLQPQARRPTYALRGTSRQLVFDSADFQLILTIKSSPNQVAIEGQLLNLMDPLAMPDGKVILRVDDDEAVSAEIDEFGHFELTHTPITHGTIQIDVDATTTLIVPLDVS